MDTGPWTATPLDILAAVYCDRPALREWLDLLTHRQSARRAGRPFLAALGAAAETTAVVGLLTALNDAHHWSDNRPGASRPTVVVTEDLLRQLINEQLERQPPLPSHQSPSHHSGRVGRVSGPESAVRVRERSASTAAATPAIEHRPKPSARAAAFDL